MTEQDSGVHSLDEVRERQNRWLRIMLLASFAILLIAIGAELPEARETAPRSTAVVMGPDDHTIVAGERVGFLRLGLPIGLVEDRLGKGLAKPTQTAVLYKFAPAGLTCAVQRGQVMSVLISNQRYRTLGEVSLGSDADRVVRELGDDYEYESHDAASHESLEVEPGLEGVSPKPVPASLSIYTLHYWRQGIHVRLKDDKVENVLIMIPTKT